MFDFIRWRQFLDLPHLHQLPGLRWKLQNLERLREANVQKFAEQSEVAGFV
jgi:hypothetical protein